jgi:serine/threonine protein kinase
VQAEPAMSADYTQPGQAMGTPRYIAPEQARGDAVDGRTDIYSLGVVAFELLTGRPPFVGDNAMELIAKHIAVPPPTPSEIEPQLPDTADRLLLRMLDKEPINRPSLEVVRDGLEEIRAPWITSITVPRKAVNPPPTMSSRAPTVARAPKRARSRIPTAVAATVLAAGASFAIVRGIGSRNGAQTQSQAPIQTQPPAAPAKPPPIIAPAEKPTPPPAAKADPPTTPRDALTPPPPRPRTTIKKPAASAPPTIAPVVTPPVVAPPVEPPPAVVPAPQPKRVDETRDGFKPLGSVKPKPK